MPEKPATPATAALVLLVIDEPALPLTRAAVTVDVSAATTLLFASSTLTIGCVAIGAPLATVTDGDWVITSLVAAPVTVTETALVAVSEPSVNVRFPGVGSVASVIAKPVNVATPLAAALVLLVNEAP